MITTAHAKKGTGLDDMFKGYKPQQLDEQRKIQYDGYHDYNSLLLRIQKFVEAKPRQLDRAAWTFQDVLPPPKIYAILEASARFENSPDYGKRMMFILERLIQNSYDAGFNHFALPLTMEMYSFHLNKEVGDVPLHGKEDNFLQLSISGSPLPLLCLNDVSFVQADIEGNGQNVCCNAEDSNIKIKGDIGNCGNVKNSSVYVDGNVDQLLTSSDLCGSTIEVTGIINDFRFKCYKISSKGLLTLQETYPVSNIFKAHQCKTVQKLLYNIPQPNEIIYVHPDGTEELVRGFYQNKKL